MKQYLFKLFNEKEYESVYGKNEFKIPSLRVSLVNSCNEDCFYCHNEGAPKNMPVSIQAGDIINTVYLLKKFGLKKVKFTGGEPLLFKDLKNLLYKIKHIADLDLFITTNGTLIKKRIRDLSPNLLNKISVSLDTLSPDVYKFITGKNLLDEVIAGLNILKKNGYNVEIDCVLLNGLNTSKNSIKYAAMYCAENGFDLQFIELSDKMPPGLYSKYYADPCAVLQNAGFNFKKDRTNDRQFFKIGGSKMTLCRCVKDKGEFHSGRRGGLRLLPNGVLKNFLYE